MAWLHSAGIRKPVLWEQDGLRVKLSELFQSLVTYCISLNARKMLQVKDISLSFHDKDYSLCSFVKNILWIDIIFIRDTRYILPKHFKYFPLLSSNEHLETSFFFLQINKLILIVSYRFVKHVYCIQANFYIIFYLFPWYWNTCATAMQTLKLLYGENE